MEILHIHVFGSDQALKLVGDSKQQVITGKHARCDLIPDDHFFICAVYLKDFASRTFARRGDPDEDA